MYMSSPGQIYTITGSANVTHVDAVSFAAGTFLTCVPFVAPVTPEPTVAEEPAAPASIAAPSSAIAANSQANAVRTGTSGSTQNRLKSGDAVTRNLASENTLFFSTQSIAGDGTNPDWNAWVSVEGRQYSGTLDGFSADLVIGVDKMVRDDLIIGGMVALGRVNLKNTTQTSEVSSTAVGAYFAKRFQDALFMDGSVTFAQPKYKTDGASFTASRTSISLGLQGSITTGKMQITPSGQLTGYSEKLPAYTGTSGAVAANTVANISLHVSAKLEPLAPVAGGILPYVTLGVDYGSNVSTAAGTQTFVAPRLGAGFSMAMDNGGNFSVDVDAGKVQSGVRDLGLRASYDFSF